MNNKEFYDLLEDTLEWAQRNVAPEVLEWFGGDDAYLSALTNDIISEVLDTHRAFVPTITLDPAETRSGDAETRELPDDLAAYIREHYENEGD